MGAQNDMTKLKKRTFLLINIMLIQTVVLVLLVTYLDPTLNLSLLNGGNEQLSVILKYQNIFRTFVLVLSLISILLIQEIIRLAKNEMKTKLLQQHLQQTEELINVLRGQLHDFKNHLTVIYGAMQLNKGDIAKDYINEISEDLSTLNAIAKIRKTEVVSLLLRKINEAVNLGVTFDVRLETDLADCQVSGKVLTRILGNLIDNAVYAVKHEQQKIVKLEISKSKEEILITVSNFRPLIPKEIIEKIFEPRFTTKGQEGSGMGLYIVKNLVQQNNGKISLVSDEITGTVFTVHLSKN